MLNDSAFIQRNDLKYLNQRRKKRGDMPVDPLYDEEDVSNILSKMISVDYHEITDVHPNLKFQFFDTAHIIGSAAITLYLTDSNQKNKVITFTGDIGRPEDQILKDPEPFPQSDYIICESTYGDRLHEKNTGRDLSLFEIVQDTCVVKKGKLIIPAFSIDRTQELIYAFDRMVGEGKLPSIPVYVDSPLSVKATNITRKYRKYYNQRLTDYLKTDAENDAFDFPSLKYISKVEESKTLNSRNEPCIIISASGMAEAGRIKHHIRNNIENHQNTILLVGYCTPDSLGGQLKSGKSEVKIFGDLYQVKSSIAVMDSYSAHGDYNEMIQYLNCQDAEKVSQIFLVHGEIEVQKAFREKLFGAGFKNVHIPKLGEIVHI
jgi:metallo-beta-lactamase family protein